MDRKSNEKFKEETMSTEEKDTRPELFKFAFCGTKEAFEDKLKSLAELAEDEKWCYNNRTDEPYHILKYYIIETFSRCLKENKILYSSDNDYCSFNTGLLTKNSQDILAFLVKNDRENEQKWKLLRFVPRENIEFMNHFDSVPELPVYWNSFDELYFNPDLDIQLNIDHIIDDNWERISSEIGNQFNKTIVKQLLNGAIIETKAKIKRNMRIVVPQYYREKIMFLVPIRFQLDEDKFVTLAIAVERINQKQYRANTIFTLEMAYSRARQLMKPEVNWLIIK